MNEKKKFKIFKDACKYWIDKLNLNHIEFEFLLMDDLEEDVIAEASYLFSAHRAYLQLSTTVDDQDEIEDAARHEVLEVFLMPMKQQAVNIKDAYHPYVQHETHAVIHILELLLNKPKKAK